VSRNIIRTCRSGAAALACSALVGTVAWAQPQFTSLHSFDGTRGFGPMPGVLQGTDDALYGTTSQGGSVNFGTVFRLDRNTLDLTILHHFAGGDGSLLYSGLVVFGRNGRPRHTVSGGHRRPGVPVAAQLQRRRRRRAR
jgi:uncharacterized repeat protein (TIGR03803 family)